MVGRGGFRVLGVVVSAVVLSGVLVSSVGAQAQDEVALLEAPEGVGGAVWSAAVRVGEGSAGGAVFGYSRWTGVGDATIGEITSVRFSFEGVRNEVHYVGYLPSDNKLYFGLARRIDSEELALRVGGRQFALGDAEVTRFASWNYTWEATGIDWAAGDIVNAHLLVPPPADPATLGGLGLDGLPEMDFDPGRSRYDVEHSPGAVTATVDAEGATDDTGVDVLVVRTDGDLGFDGTDADPNTDGHQALLSATGQTLIIVKSDDGTRERAYIVRTTPAENAGGAESQQTAKTKSTVRNQRFARSSVGRSTDSSDATLASLALVGAALDPEFAADIHTYRADAASDTTQVTVTAEPNTAGAEVAITPADADPDTDGHQVNLLTPQPGGDATETTIGVAVESADNNTLNAYTITVTRAAPESPILVGPIEELETAEQDSADITVAMDLPDNCKLLDLDGSGETPKNKWSPDCNSLFRTDPQTLARYYRLYVEDESEVQLRVYSSGSTHLLIRDAADGTVIAHDGELNRPDSYKPSLTRTLSTGLYVIEIALHYVYHVKNRTYQLYYSGDNIVSFSSVKLSDLELSNVNLGDFSTDVLSYERNIAADVSSVTVAATPTRADAIVEISPSDADDMTEGHQANLESDGETVITVSVSGQDVTQVGADYTVTLTQLPDTTSPLSDEPSLSNLEFDNVDIGTFASNKYGYSYSLGYYESLNGLTTTMTPTTNNGATWQSNRSDEDINLDGHQINVNGDDTIKVFVTSQDNSKHRTYTVAPKSAFSEDSSKHVCVDCAIQAPAGLWSDGEQIITINNYNNTFYVYSLESGSQVDSFTLWGPTDGFGLTNTKSLWSDGETIWVLYGPHSDRIHAYNYSTRQRVSSKDIVLTTNARLFSTIWSDGESMYAVDSDARLHQYDISSGARVGSIQLPYSYYAGPTFMTSDGKTLWLGTWGLSQIKAYELATGTRVPGLDLNTRIITGAKWPDGVWTNGETMWVVDSNYTIYAYAMPENARLKELSLSTGTMGVFNNGIFEYDAVVPAGTTSITVNADPAFTGGSSLVAISPADADSNSANGHQINLTAGTPTEVSITVTAPNGTDTEVYTITITHESS